MKNNSKRALSNKVFHCKSRLGVRGVAPAWLPVYIVLSVSSYPAALQAQSENKSELVLEEVVVTARRKTEQLQDVPVAVTSFSADDLESKVVVDVTGLDRTTPSLHFSANAAHANAPVVSIRGQVQNDATNATVDPSVGIYFDDVYLGRATGSLLEMFDIANVEILKGPQGTLYGRNTTGGAVRITPQKAEIGGGFTGFLRGAKGNYDQQILEGASNIPLGDELAFRVAYSQRERDGYSTVTLYENDNPDQPTGGEFKPGNKDSVSFRVNGLWDVSERLTFDLGLDSNNFESNGLPMYRVPGDDAQVNALGQVTGYTRSTDNYYDYQANLITVNDADTDGWQIRGTYQLPWFEVKVIHAQREVDYLLGNNDTDGTSARGVELEIDQQIEQDSTELQISGNLFGDRFHYLFGLYDFEEKGLDYNFAYASELLLGASSTPPGSVALLDIERFANVKNESKSAFIHMEMALTESFSVHGGFRKVKDRKQLQMTARDSGALNRGTGPASNPSNTPDCPYDPAAEGVQNDGTKCRFDRTDDFEFDLYSGGIDWHTSNENLVYLKFSRGARGGGQNLRGFTPDTLAPFDPEFVDDIELGVKSELFNRRMRANFAIYKTDYQDYQFSETIGLSTRVVNIGDASILGAEAEISSLVTQGLTLNVTASYLDFEFDDSGLVPLRSPEYKWSLGVDYLLPMGWADLGLNASYSWTDDTNFQVSRAAVESNPFFRQEDYAVVTARVSLNFPDLGLQLAAFGTNLTNEEYQGAALSGLIPESATNDGVVAEITPAAPRFYGMEIIKSFDLR